MRPPWWIEKSKKTWKEKWESQVVAKKYKVNVRRVVGDRNTLGTPRSQWGNYYTAHYRKIFASAKKHPEKIFMRTERLNIKWCWSKPTQLRERRLDNLPALTAHKRCSLQRLFQDQPPFDLLFRSFTYTDEITQSSLNWFRSYGVHKWCSSKYYSCC
jgi:hypothetical protein